MLSQEKIQLSNPMSGRSKKNTVRNRTWWIVSLSILLLLLVIYYVSSNDDSVVHSDKTTASLRSGVGIGKKELFVDTVSTQPKQVREKKKKILVLKTDLGSIRIELRPDLSNESIAYIEKLVEEGCRRCKFYRAEKPGIFQGIMASQPQVPINQVFGTCPSKQLQEEKRHCPPHDPNCSCHGPIMTRGMVGWAGGTAGGPDFFIDMYRRPATFWETQHTVWGILADPSSYDLIDQLVAMPATKRGSMTFLDEEIHFTPTLERS